MQSCSLSVSAALDYPFMFGKCQPRTTRCSSFYGHDYRYLEIIASILNCKMNISITDNMLHDLGSDIDVSVPLMLDQFKKFMKGTRFTQPVAAMNMTFRYYKQDMMTFPFWFYKPFTVSLWILLIVIGGVVIPIVSSILKHPFERNVPAKSWLVSVASKPLNYLLGYINQFPIPFESQRILHGCWLMSVMLIVAVYSSSIISYLVSEASVNEFQTPTNALRAVRDRGFKFVIVTPLSAKKYASNRESDIILSLPSFFDWQGGLRELMSEIAVRPNGEPNKSKFYFFYYNESNLQNTFEHFIKKNKKAIILGDEGISGLINCGNLFSEINFQSATNKVIRIGGKASPELIAKINNAITATYDSELFNVLVKKYAYPNETSVNRYCGGMKKGPVKLKWKYIKGLVFVCLLLFFVCILVILIEIVWKYFISRIIRKRFTRYEFSN